MNGRNRWNCGLEFKFFRLPVQIVSRRDASVFEDLIDLASRLPWWLGLSLAAISYFGLHWYANAPLPPTPTDPGKVFEVVVPAMWRGFAMFGQYFLPFAFTCGAGISAWKAQRRSRLADEVRDDPTASALNRMNWREFELVASEAFRRRGYAVTERGGAGPDGGVDLVIRKGSESTVVQCKQYRATKVGVAIVRELFGAMTAEGTGAGIVVSLGPFTRDAQAFAQGRNIRLVTGDELGSLLREGTQVPLQDRDVPNRANAGPIEYVRAAAPTVAAIAISDVLCPRCKSPMTKRVAKTGANAGKAFWGCSRFPDCRGTRELGS